jgi:hypothetical protein
MHSGSDSNPRARGLRLAGRLLIGGMVAEVVATAFHPAHQDPNDHPAVFREYAADGTWIATHVAQFAAGLVIFAGLVVLYRVLRSAAPRSALPTAALVATAAAAAALAALQAIDGVALKHAVDAWAAAPAAEKASTLADAELVRALEWGANAFFRLLQGTTVALFGVAVARAGVAPRWLGWTAATAGAGYAAAGVAVAADGFSPTAMTLALVSDPLFLVFALGLLVVGVRRLGPARIVPAARVPEPSR